jgi:transposase InsO family protein
VRIEPVRRLMRRSGIKAQVGYRSPWACKSKASVMASSRLQRKFNPDAPNERWVTDITYIRAHQGCGGPSGARSAHKGVSLDIEHYCTLSSSFERMCMLHGRVPGAVKVRQEEEVAGNPVSIFWGTA